MLRSRTQTKPQTQGPIMKRLISWLKQLIIREIEGMTIKGLITILTLLIPLPWTLAKLSLNLLQHIGESYLSTLLWLLWTLLIGVALSLVIAWVYFSDKNAKPIIQIAPPKQKIFQGFVWDSQNNPLCPKCEFPLIQDYTPDLYAPGFKGAPYCLCNKCGHNYYAKSQDGLTYTTIAALRHDFLAHDDQNKKK